MLRPRPSVRPSVSPSIGNSSVFRIFVLFVTGVLSKILSGRSQFIWDRFSASHKGVNELPHAIFISLGRFYIIGYRTHPCNVVEQLWFHVNGPRQIHTLHHRVNKFFRIFYIFVRYGSNSIKDVFRTIYWTMVINVNIVAVKVIFYRRASINIRTFHIYCPRWAKYGMRQVTCTYAVEQCEFLVNRRKMVVLRLWALSELICCETIQH